VHSGLSSECPLRVDWQSPDRESQILMVLSSLALAICFPSGLHATDLTLKSQKVSTRINRKLEGKTSGKKFTNQRARSPGTCKSTFGYFPHLNLFRACIYQQQVFVSSGLSHGHSKQEHDFLLFFSSIFLKKTYQRECPVRVDWQSPDCESQILNVWSKLPLAIFFPSGLHATEKTLKLREVNTRIDRS